MARISVSARRVDHVNAVFVSPALKSQVDSRRKQEFLVSQQ
jgi:hypothetical protein